MKFHPLRSAMHRTLIALALLASAGGVLAQHDHALQASHYSGMQGRDIKALSSEQVADLREGRGMGASLPAELNGVPGPLHVLQLAQALNVSADQRAALERIMAAMKASAQQLGALVIAAEADLDKAFKSGAADEAFVRELTSRIAALQGRLRATHLMAHLETKRLLSADQITAYNAARGYAAASPTQQHRH